MSGSNGPIDGTGDNGTFTRGNNRANNGVLNKIALRY